MILCLNVTAFEFGHNFQYRQITHLIFMLYFIESVVMVGNQGQIHIVLLFTALSFEQVCWVLSRGEHDHHWFLGLQHQAVGPPRPTGGRHLPAAQQGEDEDSFEGQRLVRDIGLIFVIDMPSIWTVFWYLQLIRHWFEQFLIFLIDMPSILTAFWYLQLICHPLEQF